MRKRKRRNSYPARHRRLLHTFRPHYDHQLVLQDGGCAICGRPPSEKRRLDIDHDHKHMVIRGLLCVRCNRALPMWITSAWLRIAAEYLDDPPAAWFSDTKGETP